MPKFKKNTSSVMKAQGRIDPDAMIARGKGAGPFQMKYQGNPAAFPFKYAGLPAVFRQTSAHVPAAGQAALVGNRCKTAVGAMLSDFKTLGLVRVRTLEGLSLLACLNCLRSFDNCIVRCLFVCI